MLPNKNMWLAFLVSFLLGPLGYIYLGIKYCCSAVIIFLGFILFLFAINLDPVHITSFLKNNPFNLLLIISLPSALAWRAYIMAKSRNSVIAENDGDAVAMLVGDKFAHVFAITLPLLEDLFLFYSAALFLCMAAGKFIGGNIVGGVFALLGVPVVLVLINLTVGNVIQFIRLKMMQICPTEPQSH